MPAYKISLSYDFHCVFSENDKRQLQLGSARHENLPNSIINFNFAGFICEQPNASRSCACTYLLKHVLLIYIIINNCEIKKIIARDCQSGYDIVDYHVI